MSQQFAAICNFCPCLANKHAAVLPAQQQDMCPAGTQWLWHVPQLGLPLLCFSFSISICKGCCKQQCMQCTRDDADSSHNAPQALSPASGVAGPSGNSGPLLGPPGPPQAASGLCTCGLYISLPTTKSSYWAWKAHYGLLTISLQ